MFEERLEKLNNLPDNLSGKYILYSMEASLREDFNFSLEFAMQKANKLNKPLLVSFFITDKYKHSNQRYYKFVIEGILKTKKAIEERGIKFVIQKDDYVNGTLKLSKEAVCIVLDKNYLKTQRKWRENIAKASQVAVYQLENDVVVPIQVVSDKPIPYAYLYRDRLNKVIDRFLKPVEKIDLKVNSKDLDVESLEFKYEGDNISSSNIANYLRLAPDQGSDDCACRLGNCQGNIPLKCTYQVAKFGGVSWQSAKVYVGITVINYAHLQNPAVIVGKAIGIVAWYFDPIDKKYRAYTKVVFK